MLRPCLALALGVHLGAASLPAPAQDAEQRAADLQFLVEQLQTTHPDPFQVHDRGAWQRHVEELQGRLAELDPVSYFIEMATVMALAADGHTGLRMPAEVTAALGEEYLPIVLESYSDGLFVSQAAPDFEYLLGGRVVEVGGRSAQEVLIEVSRTISADNPFSAKRNPMRNGAHLLSAVAVHRWLGLDEEAPAFLVQHADGSEDEIFRTDAAPESIQRGRAPTGWVTLEPEAVARSQAHTDRPYWFERMDEGGMYFQYNLVRDDPQESLADFCARMFDEFETQGCEFLVIDLRHNGGGNNYLNQPLVHGLIRKDTLSEPGNLFVLTGPSTFSAAMSCCGAIEANVPALFVGEPTGSGPNQAGDAVSVTLPNSGWTARISTLWWQFSDPRDVRRTILPDLPAPLTMSDWMAGRDAALEAVLDFRRAPDPSLLREGPPNAAWMSK